MRKVLLNTDAINRQQVSVLSATAQSKNNEQLTQKEKFELDRLLRKTRSAEYMQAWRMLDSGGHTSSREKAEKMIAAIRSEFPEVEINGIMLGIVAVCNLGEPYEVHTLDITESIVEHYKRGQILPDGLEKARSIAMRGGYELIEVYLDCCRAISSNGTVSVIH